MSYQVTVASGQQNVVLPDGLRHKPGDTVTLTNDQYAQLTSSALSSLLTGAVNENSLSVAATTGTGGFALQNATPTILTWTVPNDGQLHMFTVVSVLHVTSAETGGVVQVVYQSPVSGAGSHFSQILAGGLATDTNGQTGTTIFGLAQAGTSVTVQQTSALTAGAASLRAEIWAL